MTTLLSHKPTWTGLGEGILILAVLWWAWASYAWLTNTADLSAGIVLTAVLVAMAAMFVAGLALPQAFVSHGVLFGVAFLVVSVTLVMLYAATARSDPALFGAVLRTVPWVLGGATLILVAGFVDEPWRVALWIAALVFGFVLPGLADVGGWRVRPGHFVERHGLIVLIAIGESLVAIGLGTRGIALGAGEITGAVLGLLVATSLWLAYFDFFQVRGRQLLAGRTGRERVAIARDIYTYFHLPMVVGIILFAFGVKVTLTQLSGRLGAVEAVALCGGPALYLLAYVGLRYRLTRTLGRGRWIAAVACALLIPVALYVPALVSLALVAAVWVALHAYELIWYRTERAEAQRQRFALS